MRRLLRILFNAATLLSLVLCVATVTLWARCFLGSAAHYDAIVLTRVVDVPDGRSQRRIVIWSHSGAVHVGAAMNVIHGPIPSDPGAAWALSSWQIRGPVRGGLVAWEPGTLGWSLENTRNASRMSGGGVMTQDSHNLSVPLWVLVLSFALLPASRFWMLLRRRWRRGKGLCPCCGYDLRATPDRCPECGAVAAGVKA